MDERPDDGEAHELIDDRPAPPRPRTQPPAGPKAPAREDEPALADEQGGRRRRRRRGRRGRGGKGRDTQPIPQEGGDVDPAVFHEEEAAIFEPPIDGAGVDEPAPGSDEMPESIEVAGEALDVFVEESSANLIEAEVPENEPDGNRRSPPTASGQSDEGDGGEPRRRRRRRGGRGRGRKSPSEQNGETPRNDENPARQPALEKSPPPRRLPPPQVAPQPLPVTRTGSTDRHLIHDDPVIPEPIHRPRSYRDLDQIPDDLD